MFAGGLNPTSSATVVRSTDGAVSMTDGPGAVFRREVGRCIATSGYELGGPSRV